MRGHPQSSSVKNAYGKAWLFLGVGVGLGFCLDEGASLLPFGSGGRLLLQTCFTPREQCLPLLLSELKKAQRRILVQAYSFTSLSIAQALIEAKQRGVDACIIADKSQETARKSTLPLLIGKEIEVVIDNKVAIAHNKVMIIDDRAVITGSYNWTESAERRNAENLLVITDQKTVDAYKENWRRRYHTARKHAF